MVKCQFCDSIFASNASMKHHQQKARYCLEKQNLNIQYLICKSCKNEFTTKRKLISHEQICIAYISDRYENKINLQKIEFEKKILEQEEKYEKQIKELQDKLENIALKAVSKPTTVNNNNSRVNQIINNLTPITTQHLTDHAKFLTLDHIKDGASGYAKYALEYPLKDKIICVDYARKKVKYKDEEGNLVDDPEMTKLAKKFFMAIETYNNNLLTNYNAEILQKMLDVGGDNNEMTQEEADKCILLGNALFEEMVRVKSIKTDIEDIKKGNKPDLYYDFVKDVCSKTTC
jgi:hypothetical protein